MAAIKRTTKKLELFSFAGHIGEPVVDYADLYLVLEQSDVANRSMDRGERTVVLRSIHRLGDRISIKVYEGDKGKGPLIYDTSADSERTDEVAPPEMVAEVTHATIAASARIIAVEYNLRGAKVGDIQKLVEHIYNAEKGLTDFRLTITPIADGSFMESVDRFTRIHSAELAVERPNYGWKDYDLMFTELTGDSGAQTATLGVTASSGNGLSKAKGIIKYLRDLTGLKNPAVSAARVSGTKAGSVGMTSVSLDKNVKGTRVRLPVDNTGHVSEDDMTARLNDLLDASEE